MLDPIESVEVCAQSRDTATVGSKPARPDPAARISASSPAGRPHPPRQGRLLADAAFAGAQLEVLLRPVCIAFEPLEARVERLHDSALAPEDLPSPTEMQQARLNLTAVEPLVTLLTQMVESSATVTVTPRALQCAKEMMSQIRMEPLTAAVSRLERHPSVLPRSSSILSHASLADVRAQLTQLIDKIAGKLEDAATVACMQRDHP